MFCFPNEFGSLSFHKYAYIQYAPEYDEILKNNFCELLGAVKELLMTVPELSSMG